MKTKKKDFSHNPSNSVWQSFPAHNILEFEAFSLERVRSKLVASIRTGSALFVPLTAGDLTRWSLWLEPSWDQTAGSGKKTSGPLRSPLKTCPLIIFVSVSEQVSGNYAESSLPLQESRAVSLWHVSDGEGHTYTSEVWRRKHLLDCPRWSSYLGHLYIYRSFVL